MRELKKSINEEVKSNETNNTKVPLKEKLPTFIKYAVDSHIPGYPTWKCVFMGNRLPSNFRTHLRLISGIKSRLGLPWNPSKDSMQFDLTSFCNLSCPNCERSIGQAPCKEYISLEQIKRFISESMELNMKWKALHLIGGEPTLHPQFFEVLDVIKQYRDTNPECFVLVWTNGYGTRVNKVLSQLPPWVLVKNSSKDPMVTPAFRSYNVAPIDLEEYKNANFSKGCYVTELCGIDMTRYGFYPCGPGGAVDRVFGFDIGIKKISDITDEKLRNQLNTLCRYCGYYKTSDIGKKNRITKEEISISWEKAYEDYRKKVPELTLY